MPLISTETGRFNTSYAEEVRINQSVYKRVAVSVLVLLAFAVVPFVVSSAMLATLTLVGTLAVGAIGLNILTGFTGKISLGHAALSAVGAFTAGNMMLLGAPFLVALLVAPLVAGLVSLPLGLIALRIKGLYLAIATLAMQFLVEWVLANWTAVTGGFQGVIRFPREQIGPLDLGTPLGRYLFTFIILALSVVFAQNLFRSRSGRAFIAIRDQDLAAEGVGISQPRYLVRAFFISSAYAGIAGALYGLNVGLITNEAFTFDHSIEYLAMILIGGLGSVPGAIIGAAVIVMLPILLREGLGTVGMTIAPSVEVYALLILYGLAILLILILEPRGLYGLYSNIRDYFRMWPYSY